MIPCPSCRGRSKNLDTRDVVDGAQTFVRRRKECLVCGKRFTTSETVVQEYGSSLVMQIQVKAAEALLKAIIEIFDPVTAGRASQLAAALLNRQDKSSG